MTIKTWRTETRQLWPFAHVENAWRSSALRLTDAEEFDATRQTFALDDVDLERDINYEVQLGIDVQELARVSRLAPKDVDVVLVLESDDSKRRRSLHRVSLSKIPPRFEGKIAVDQFSPRRLVLRLLAVLNKGRKPSGADDAAWRLGSIVAERAFVIGPAPDALFRVHWTSFKERKWPEDALWFVDVKNEDLLIEDVDIDEVLHVHLNADLPLLVEVWKPGAPREKGLAPLAGTLRPLITAEILSSMATIVSRYLSPLVKEAEYDLEELTSGSLAASVLTGVASALKLSKPEVLDLASNDPEKLRMAIQDVVGIGKAFTSAALERVKR